MIPMLIARLIGLGVPAKAAKPILAVLGGLLLLGALWGLKSCYDHSVIDKHSAKQEAATAKADRKADAKAAETRLADQARETAEATQIKEALNEAGPDPAARRAAYYRCVRVQQAARAAHKPPADC